MLQVSRIKKARDDFQPKTEAIMRSPLLAITKRLLLKTSAGRAARRALRAFRTRNGGSQFDQPASMDNEYRQWLSQHPDEEPRQFENEISGPTISIVLPIRNANEDHLRQLLDSIAAQTCGKWQLCAIDHGSTPGVTAKVVRRLVDRFPKQVIYRRVAAGLDVADAGNAAIALADGEFVAFLDQDSVLNVNALAAIVDAIRLRPETDLLYTDHDVLAPTGERISPQFKPAWSPELLQCSNYLRAFVVCRREMLARVGGLRSGLAGNEVFDLILRLSETTDHIAHITGVHYHERTRKDGSANPAIQSAMRAVQGHVDRIGVPATVRWLDPKSDFANGSFKLDFRFESFPRVTIVIPTKDRVELLRTCLSSLERNTTYPNYDVVIVDNGSRERATFEYYEQCRHRIISCSLGGRFNFSALVNEGVRSAKGEFVLLLNNDIEIIQRDWLHELVGYGRLRDVGAVGAKLLYPDRRIQHAGVVMGHEGLTGHYFQGESSEPSDSGYLGLKNKVRNVAAVTGACLLTPRALYEEVGGFDEENLAVAWNDVDYCLRLLKKGLRIILNPHAVLIHHEGASRGEAKNGNEVRYMMRTWPDLIQHDPYYHAYYSRTGNSFRLRLDPREDERYFYHQYPKALVQPGEEVQGGVAMRR
jgi:GT2 family glycosyltransferase